MFYSYLKRNNAFIFMKDVSLFVLHYNSTIFKSCDLFTIENSI